MDEPGCPGRYNLAYIDLTAADRVGPDLGEVKWPSS